jgi:hypothetical protein
MARKRKKRGYYNQVLHQPVDCRWFPGANSVQEYNPDKPTRTVVRAHRRLLDQLLSAGDITTARKIVDTHPYLRDYEEKIRQCVKELRRERIRDELRRLRLPMSDLASV